MLQPLAEGVHHALRIVLVFEADDKVSSPGESHPRALAEPDVNVSAHPAPERVRPASELTIGSPSSANAHAARVKLSQKGR